MTQKEDRLDISQEKRIGVLVTNLGTPSAPTSLAIWRYLSAFLNDPRVIEIPKILWLPILWGIILPFRSSKVAKLYRKIWRPEGSPLRITLEKQVQKLQENFQGKITVIPAMRYGEPSIEKALAALKAKRIHKLLVLPLYPQYSATTTASTFDEVAKHLKQWRWQPELRTINGYHNNEYYIQALAQSIQAHWAKQGKKQKLLFSFHGLPQQFVLKGDPYKDFCHETARLVSTALALKPEEWGIAFQSRFGKAAWLQPYTDECLQTWVSQGIKQVTVICPGFSADCLETLEEIQHTSKTLFLRAGGEMLNYIPALNDSDAHLALLTHLIHKHTQGW